MDTATTPSTSEHDVKLRRFALTAGLVLYSYACMTFGLSLQTFSAGPASDGDLMVLFWYIGGIMKMIGTPLVAIFIGWQLRAYARSAEQASGTGRANG